MATYFHPSQPVQLRELLAGAEVVGAGDILATGCSADSRTCRSGDVFVAVSGTTSDGHDYIAEAIARGATAIVTEQPLEVDVPTCIVPDAREAWAQLCQALAGRPSDSLKVIGITGTNGKTTTLHLIASVLAASGHRAGTLGTLGYSDTVDWVPAELTTPAPNTLALWLARMQSRGCGYAVMEVSSHAIAQRRIAGLEFAQVCLTNLGRDHLDFHGSLLDYHREKTRLFNYLSPGGVAVINADDAACLENAPLIPGGVLTIGMQRPADISGQVIERFKSEQTFLLTAGEVTVPVRTRMIGDHHVYNCLMATAVGLAEGLDLTAIVRGLETVEYVPGRLERIECGQPFGVFVDFAHTPEALSVALSTLRDVTPGRLICVFGAGGNRDALKRPLMGRAVESLADLAIVTNDNPRFEDPLAIAAEIRAGFERPSDARWVPDRIEAIHYALSLAGPDDCVLIAGRGHEQYQIIGHEHNQLDDRDVARRWLYNLEPGSQYGSLMTVGNS